MEKKFFFSLSLALILAVVVVGKAWTIAEAADVFSSEEPASLMDKLNTGFKLLVVFGAFFFISKKLAKK